VPYLHCPPAMTKKWCTQLKKFDGLKVGIAWAGSKSQGKDQLRSVALERFAPLVAVENVQFVSLQKDAAMLQLKGKEWPILDWMDICEDFLDTAALMGNLDLIICVDTAIVHLAGALGKPVWLLNRFESEWRWMIDREDSPWYPTMRIFRQPTMHDWDSVMKTVAFELEKLASGQEIKAISSEQWKKAARAADRALGIDKNKAKMQTRWGKLSTLWRR